MTNRGFSGRSRLLKSGASTVVLSAALAAMLPASALAQEVQDQDAPEAQDSSTISGDTDPEDAGGAVAPIPADAIIVTGQRRALQTSRDIKRNADTIVDSITATDIGAFPDKSIAEALQRVPGVTVNRFAASTDTAHFSAEPSGVIVRGLPQVRSEYNGRDTFSANSSRGLSWGDVTPELMAGVDTYKNQTAEMIEGGIAGTINLRTRVPFDAEGQLIQVGVNGNYGDISKELTPDANAFYSNRWDTDIGEFGIMGNVAYSHVVTASQGIQYGRVAPIDNGFGPDGPETAYVPYSINFLDNEYERKRLGIAAAAQWRSPSRDILVTAQYQRSQYKNNWQERSVGAFGIGPDLYGLDVRTRVSPTNLGDRIPIPAPGTGDFTFDEDGFFQSGTPARTVAWWGNPGTNVGFGVNDEGTPMFNACYNWGADPRCEFTNGVALYGPGVGVGSRINQNDNMTQDAALNVKWEATDRLRFNFDGQFVDSSVENYDLSVEHHSFANVGVDGTGELPRVTFSPPTNINQSAGGLANPNNYYLRSVMDHLEDSEGQQWAFRADAEYDIGTEWLESIKVGARYADRDQNVRWSTYNWANVANTWTDFGSTPHPYWNLDSHTPSGSFTGYPQGLYETSSFGSDFFGGNLGDFVFVPVDALNAHRPDEYSRDLIGVGEFRPICTRLNELPDSCFAPGELADVSETTKAIYAMLRFGGNGATFADMPISGNIGIRYVDTKNRSAGFTQFPVNNYVFQNPDGTDICDNAYPVPTDPNAPPPPPGTPRDPAQCYLSAEDLAFINGGSVPSTVKAHHRHWLPSLNLRIDLSRQWLIRFAASRALSRPDMGQLKNFTAITAGLPNPTDINDPRWIRDANGDVVGVTPQYRAQAYNPRLAPTTAWQVDISLEHYFGDAGMFSFALFHKQFDDYIQQGSFELDFTNNGTTRSVDVRGPSNGKGAKIQGFELAYNRFFDFLPAPLDGLGIQSNYTYVRNSGVPNYTLVLPSPPASGDQVNAGTLGSTLNPNSLEGLSKHSFNLVGLYEKGPIAARLAYNWRSKYLVTVVDCCVYLPVWQEPAGYLDGSLRFRVNDNIELSLQGSNLLNTKTKLLTQIADEDSPEGRQVLVPNAWFQNDRRFTFGVRVRY